MYAGTIFVLIGLLAQSLIADAGETPTTPVKKCKSGWTELKLTTAHGTYGPVCVKVNSTKATFLNAVKACRQDGGELATILNDDYQNAVQSLIKSKEKHWIGLSDFGWEGDYVWVSGYKAVPATFWAKSEPNDEMNHQDCVVIDPSKQSNVSWYDEHCTDELPSVCMQANFTGAPSGIVLETVNGTCPSEFFRMGNRCLKLFSNETLNYEDARKKCQTWKTLNGDLASVYSAEEQNILTAMMANQPMAFWIGLHLIPKRRTHVWTRGFHTVIFTNWKIGEPNGGISHSKTYEQCVMMYRRGSSPGEWNDQRCDMKLGYICGVDLKNGTNADKEVNPLIKPGSQSSDCKNDEFEFDNYCYKSLADQFTSYASADAACQKFNKLGHLATPHSAYDVAFSSVLMNYLKINYTLLGFHVKEVSNGFKIIAADNSTNVGFESLKGLMFYEAHANDSIASTGDPQHKVQWRNSTQKKPAFKAICNYPLKKSTFHPSNTNFTCPKDWSPITGGRCIQLILEKKDMINANAFCAKNNNGSLLSILNVHDQQAAAKLVKTAGTNVWIGLEVNFDSTGEISRVRWSDSSPVQFIHWRAGEPTTKSRSGSEEKCVALRRKSTDWNNEACSKLYPFICSIAGTPHAAPVSPSTVKPTATTPASTPSTSTVKPQTNPTTKPKSKPTPKPKPKCPNDFKDSKKFSFCYKIVMQRTTWHKAEHQCSTQPGSHLMSIHSQQEQSFVNEVINQEGIKDPLWIGLTDLYSALENQFAYWSDNTSMTVVFMNKSQESYFGNQDCVVFTPTTKPPLGVWNKRHCTVPAKGYICKWDNPQGSNKNPVPRRPDKAPGSYCLDGFVKFNQTCYKLMKKPRNYKDAEKECKNIFAPNYRKYIQLARINQLEDNDFLLSLLSPIKNGAAWIGMHYEKGQFHWTDNWPVHFTKWPVNMTSTNKETTCVALGASTVTILSGFWYARNCHEKHPFLCQAPLLKAQPPAKPLKCHDSYTLYKDGKTCYRRLNDPTTFEDGKKLCEADQKKLKLKTRPTLLTIDSVFEMSFFRAWMVVSGAPYDRPVWVGLKLKKDKPVWKWISGEPVDFTYTSGLPEDISGCYYMYIHRKVSKDADSPNLYGMHPDPSCGSDEGGKKTTVCKYSLETKAVVPKPTNCLARKDGIGYTGHEAVTASGKPCVRWDNLNNIHLLVQLGANKIGGADSNFCRNPTGQHKRARPYCYTSRGKSNEAAKWEYCDIDLCSSAMSAHVGSHSYVVAVAILVIVLLVTMSFFVGVMLWRRTNTARGFIPYLRQHDPEGGTSFHNPIYTPAANC